MKCLTVMLVSLTLNFLLIGQSAMLKITVIDALTNQACSSCSIRIFTNEQEDTFSLDSLGSYLLDIENKLSVAAIPADKNYFGAIHTYNKKQRFTIDTIYVFPNKHFEDNQFEQNNCLSSSNKKENTSKGIAFNTLDNMFDEFDAIAEFDGDMNAFLIKTIKYPEIALEQGDQGKVYAAFIIEKDGSLTCPEIIRGISPELDAETLRVLRLMPQWRPAIKDKEPVRVFIRLPFNYRLN